MKVSLEVLLLGYVTVVCSVIGMALMFKQIWPIALVCVIAHYVYRYKIYKDKMPKKVPKDWIDQND